ncbi:CinA family protein [Devosia nitrariae]|uniref:Competence damage-inducible protein A n=1 Tax=Devosia nitrariae TaxID=2071872 RepID=A0ABQ5WCD3_9HYPH|nr:CinA family protein [Devosia nitrariae]GLQ57759.1 competence damage-inducible protein A [Devosia nitrariae]
MAAKPLPDPAKRVIELLTQAKATIATAESCTGGLVAGALTDVPGSSAVFYGGYVTYDNAAKTRMIRVPARLIRDYGAVSNQVARAMADGARNTAHTDYALAVTGIAGPDGGSEKKPVGLVYLAVSSNEGTKVIERRFGDLGREAIRKAAVAEALKLVLDVVENGVGSR